MSIFETILWGFTAAAVLLMGAWTLLFAILILGRIIGEVKDGDELF